MTSRSSVYGGREAARDWAIWTMAQPDLLILDTETTGLHGDAEVISVGAVNLHGHAFRERYHPFHWVPREAQRIHGSMNRDLARENTPTFAEGGDWLREQFALKHVVIYNAAFDVRMINQTAALYGLPEVTLPFGRCAMEAFAAYWGDWSDYFGSYKWQKLIHAAAWAGHEYQAHDALADARATLAVIQAMAEGKPV